MKKGLKITLIILLVLGAAAGTYLYFNPKKALNVIIPEFRDIEKINISLLKDTLLIDGEVRFENKSIFKLTLDSLIYHIRLDTLTLLSGRQHLKVRMQPSQEDTVDLNLRLPFRRLGREIKDLQGRDSVAIVYNLRIVYATWLGKAVLPYRKTMMIAVPVPPELDIQGLSYKKRHHKLFYFDARVKVINKGKLDLHISGLNYELLIKDKLRAQGKDPQEIYVKPGSETLVTLPLRVEFDHVLKTLLNILTDKDKVNYCLSIRARARTSILSGEYTEIRVEKNGIAELKE